MSQKCPNCKKTLSFIPPVYMNLETYGGSSVAKSGCCGTALNVRIEYKFDVTKYEGDSETDDWGNKIEKPKSHERTRTN